MIGSSLRGGDAIMPRTGSRLKRLGGSRLLKRLQLRMSPSSLRPDFLSLRPRAKNSRMFFLYGEITESFDKFDGSIRALTDDEISRPVNLLPKAVD
jgi:hypothetical protein